MTAPALNFVSAQTASLAARQLGWGAARCARLGHFLAIHLHPRFGHQASNQFANFAEVVHSVKTLSYRRSVLNPEAIEDGFSHAQISFAPGAKAHD